jgi:hypothetical protein
MKNINAFIYLLIILLLTNCKAFEDDKVNSVVTNKVGGPYIELVSSAAQTIRATRNGLTSVVLPIPILENVSFTYKLEGTAVYGTDYNITGLASPTTPAGTITFKADSNTPDQTDLTINNTKTLGTGSKTVIITLVSATAPSGKAVSVGRVGSTFRISRTITLTD